MPAHPLIERVLVSGENLTRAEVTTDQNRQTAIGFRFDGAGARRFGEPEDLDGPLLLARDRDQPLRYDTNGVHPPEPGLWG